ncbi:MAG: hypothetical protein KDK39_10060, partial [Leptospiraceae bacterium]|nr:hypothetical protein [Leptospiraceae bacterium]
MRLWLLAILLILQGELGAREVRYPAGLYTGNPAQFQMLDQRAVNTTPEQEASLAGLTHYLTAPAQSELQKVRVIWKWITTHIAYDVEGYPKKNRPMITKASEAFHQRIAVCGGYANLFKAMADMAGVEARVITGKTKLDVGQLWAIGHAWNAVRIDGYWYLLDATGGAGTVLDFYHPDKARYTFRYEEYWFLPHPKYMAFSHAPEDPDWQLLKDPVLPYDFLYFPLIRPEFGRLGLWFAAKPSGQIHIKPDQT